MDRADLDAPRAQRVVRELNQLLRDLRRDGLPVSSWYGRFDVTANRFQWANRGFDYKPLPDAVDDANWPWFLYWEIVWLVTNNEYREGDQLLDLGGSSSLFSYYLASQGLRVTTVDLQRHLVENANSVASRTGWHLENFVGDMRDLRFERTFDHVTSVCVFEHIPLSGRIAVNERIRALLRDGGTFSITFDYRNPSRAAGISSPEAVNEQFVKPSGLSVRGNREFYDNGKRYLVHPFFRPEAWRRGWKPRFLLRREFGLRDLARVKGENDYTFGSLFMKR